MSRDKPMPCPSGVVVFTSIPALFGVSLLAANLGEHPGGHRPGLETLLLQPVLDCPVFFRPVGWS